MGITWYLRRDDNRTLFDLGTGSTGWLAALGEWPMAQPRTIGPDDETRISEVIAADIASRAASWEIEPGEIPGYASRIARAIIAWADGKPYTIASEEGFHDWLDDDTWDFDRAVTGSRYLAAADGSHAG